MSFLTIIGSSYMLYYLMIMIIDIAGNKGNSELPTKGNNAKINYVINQPHSTKKVVAVDDINTEIEKAKQEFNKVERQNKNSNNIQTDLGLETISSSSGYEVTPENLNAWVQKNREDA